MNNHIFNVIIMSGRPASGKSEIIDYLTKLPTHDRLKRYHIGQMDVIDDFPMLWTWFEEDDILSKVLGQPRLHTNQKGYFNHQYQWHLLIERIGLEYHKRLRDDPAYHQHTTTIVEFSRGSEHGGYSQAVSHLPDDLLRRAGMLYVKVSYEESLRKNRLRFNPEKPDSILEHSLPDEKLERLYRHDDWGEFSAGNPHYLNMNGTRIPYAVFENDDDVTTNSTDLLSERLQNSLSALWESYKRKI